MKGVKHYKTDGTEWKGNTHKMPNGELHTYKNHTDTSQKLVHFRDLSKRVQNKIKNTA